MHAQCAECYNICRQSQAIWLLLHSSKRKTQSQTSESESATMIKFFTCFSVSCVFDSEVKHFFSFLKYLFSFQRYKRYKNGGHCS